MFVLGCNATVVISSMFFSFYFGLQVDVRFTVLDCHSFKINLHFISFYLILHVFWYFGYCLRNLLYFFEFSYGHHLLSLLYVFYIKKDKVVKAMALRAFMIRTDD